MYAFVASVLFKNQVFAINDRDDVWRIWFDDGFPSMQMLIGNEPEFYGVIQLLKFKKGLYR